jgi:hypothetical protein
MAPTVGFNCASVRRKRLVIGKLSGLRGRGVPRICLAF